jgi:hypothetical protein
VTEPKQKLLYSNALECNLSTMNMTLDCLESENDTHQDQKSKAELRIVYLEKCVHFFAVDVFIRFQKPDRLKKARPF